jgi:hypothetical protein
LWFSSAISNPLTSVVPRFVESEQTSLSATFDKLIGFCDEFCGKDPGRELSVWGDGVCGWVPSDLGDFWRGINKVGGDCAGTVECRCTGEPIGK